MAFAGCVMLQHLLDIPTHAQFFPTPVFYLSDFGVDGTRWSDPFILVPNVLLLAGLWFYVKRKDRLQATEQA